MPVSMPTDLHAAYWADGFQLQNRSLFFTLFADPGAKPDDKNDGNNLLKFYEVGLAKAPSTQLNHHHLSWLRARAANCGGVLLRADLMARLLVNVSGGVMENAAIALDRCGLPIIPGSAVKGCGRRMAVQMLKELSEEQRPQHLLLTLLAFGWVEADWKSDSDFAQAVGSKAEWVKLKATVQSLLADHFQSLGIKLPVQFMGSVAFLAAVPDPGGKVFGALELDVLTCHHPEYYEGNRPGAPDTEDPNPVYFPAISPGHRFVFPLLPLRVDAKPKVLPFAEQMLRQGLAIFGLGAKTSAGYGWFTPLDESQTTPSQP